MGTPSPQLSVSAQNAALCGLAGVCSSGEGKTLAKSCHYAAMNSSGGSCRLISSSLAEVTGCKKLLKAQTAYHGACAVHEEGDVYLQPQRQISTGSQLIMLGMICCRPTAAGHTTRLTWKRSRLHRQPV